MAHDFDRLVERRGTESNKWRKYDPDVLPLWVADMDFPSPPPVVRALAERVAHGIFGYGPTLEQVTELHELVAARLARLHGWRVAPETVVLLPGVIPGFNVACRMLAAPGDGLLLQLPLYPPIRRVPGNCGLTTAAPDLARAPDGSYAVDWEAFEAAVGPRTRVFLLCNPHNPTGRAFPRDQLAPPPPPRPRSSGSRRAWRPTTARRSGPAARGSCGSTSPARARGSSRRSSACAAPSPPPQRRAPPASAPGGRHA